MKIINTLTKDFWDEVVSKSGNATFFHSPTWAEIISQTYPEMRIATKGIEFGDGTRAVFPLISVRTRLNGIFNTYYSMVPGVYGGIISDGRRLTTVELEMIFSRLKTRKFNHIIYVDNPFESYEIPESYQKREMFTHVLKLNSDFEITKRNFSRGNKSNINKSKRRGVSIENAQTEADYKEYYEIYNDSLSRWGDHTSSRYSFELFHNIYKINSPNIKLWLAKVDNKAIAGALVFYQNKHAVAWHGACLQSHFDFRPNNLLYAEIIRDVCEQGYKYFDFNPSGGHEGVVRFKESFGTKRLNFQVHRWSSNSLYRTYLKHRIREQS